MRTHTAGETVGEYTGAIESQTSKIPSGIYLTAAIGSTAASTLLKILGKVRLAELRRALGARVFDSRRL
jgi:hypothetical protein